MKQSNSFDDKTDIDDQIFEYIQMQEREADILACIEGGPKMCGWLRDYFIFMSSALPEKTTSKISTKIVEIELTYDYTSPSHPSNGERIGYFEPIISEMKNDDDPNKCFNPYYRINGLPRWVDCGDCNKNITKVFLALFKKMTY